MTKVLRGVFALLLVVFLGACVEDDAETEPETSKERVKTPVITMDPNRPFNNEAITVTLSSSTSGAELYYTLDGSAPSSASTKYTAPFPLEPGDANIKDTPHHGSIEVKVIGIKEGFYNSTAVSQFFQVFSTMPGSTWGNKTTEASGTGQGREATIQVSFQLENGTIKGDSITITEIEGNDTAEYYSKAVDRAQEFLSLMNHWDFDAVSGASLSSTGIRDAAKNALIEAGVIPSAE